MSRQRSSLRLFVRFTSGIPASSLGLLPLALLTLFATPPTVRADVPLPEHPRPDFERDRWINLNGSWSFRFDGSDRGESEMWYRGDRAFPLRITVPFPWGSELSGVEDMGDIGWYSRSITVPPAWEGHRVFLVVGACDWLTKGWLDGRPIGSYRGGYTPFELELTPHVRPGQPQRLVLRVDDRAHPFKLEGKQGYGPARGIWQTVYLEARPAVWLDSIHFTPDIEEEKAGVSVRLSERAPADGKLALRFASGAGAAAREHEVAVPEGALEMHFDVPVPSPRLWTLEDPWLYELEAVLRVGDRTDAVGTYFGMREIGVTRLPGSGHPYVSLNGRPVYLQLTLDQAYHPEGFYTFPSDEFVRDEILRCRRIGLNGLRIHVKIDSPRKLYWADRLGLLVMADVPNSWGEPDAEMRRETETALRGMIARDYNHPSIFSWVIFNETWGLRHRGKGYTRETQDWVARMYRLAKALDPTRLVEDNSPCRYDHVVTDLNTWHAYLPGYEWRKFLDDACEKTFPGSGWNYVEGRRQGDEPMLNSECGNVWGYEGSTGDVDWSWDYHIMMNELRRHPKCAGWLYTEHHDVINEWNGYWRFDRSGKITGLSGIVDGMRLEDLHAPVYIATGGELCRDVEPGEEVRVDLWGSFFTDRLPASRLRLRSELYGWDALGRRREWSRQETTVPASPWASHALEPIAVTMPPDRGLAVLALRLESPTGEAIHRNFTTFRVGGASPRDETVDLDGGSRARLVRFAPASCSRAEWSLKTWSVLDGKKVNGAGHGRFEYRVKWPAGLDLRDVRSASLRFEASAKRLHGKDRDDAGKQEGDFMRGKGTQDPSLNPNSYPMTDTRRFPSSVWIRVGGGGALVPAGVRELHDDPADHRGILSWHAQPRDRHLREAGSYGYLVECVIPEAALRAAHGAGELSISLEVDASLPGGLAIYGESFGRYPLDPTLAFVLR